MKVASTVRGGAYAVSCKGNFGAYPVDFKGFSVDGWLIPCRYYTTFMIVMSGIPDI